MSKIIIGFITAEGICKKGENMYCITKIDNGSNERPEFYKDEREAYERFFVLTMEAMIVKGFIDRKKGKELINKAPQLTRREIWDTLTEVRFVDRMVDNGFRMADKVIQIWHR